MNWSQKTKSSLCRFEKFRNRSRIIAWFQNASFTRKKRKPQYPHPKNKYIENLLCIYQFCKIPVFLALNKPLTWGELTSVHVPTGPVTDLPMHPAKDNL
jgi:hypothetical protein